MASKQGNYTQYLRRQQTYLLLFIGYYQPPLRGVHSTVVINDKVYMWGGQQKWLSEVHNSVEKKTVTSFIDVFSVADGVWRTQPTTGTPPLGVCGYACTSIKNSIYFFGGYCGHKGCYHNSLYVLDIVSLRWIEISPTADSDGLPIKKCASGMISFTSDSVLVVGGRGLATKILQPHSTYVRRHNSEVVTNEQHVYNFSKGESP